MDDIAAGRYNGGFAMAKKVGVPHAAPLYPYSPALCALCPHIPVFARP